MSPLPKPKPFRWQAIDIQGFKKSGHITAINRQAALQQLQQQQLTVLNLTATFNIKSLFSEPKLKRSDITQFSIELASLIHAGISLSLALQILINSSTKPIAKRLITAIKQRVDAGHPLSEALVNHPEHFDALFCNLIAVGEQSGTLDIVLKKLAAHLEKMDHLRDKIKKALYYPCLIVLVASGVVAAMLLWIMPQFQQLFSSVGAELPTFTRWVMRASHIMRDHGLWLLVCVAFTVVLFYIMAKRSIHFKTCLHTAFLKIPAINTCWYESLMARCLSVFAMTLQAGLPLLDALQLVTKITRCIPYIKAFDLISDEVRNGHRLHLAFANTKRFSPRTLALIEVGEESGQLQQMLQNLADYFAERTEQRVKTLLQLLEPAIMVFLSVVVGGLVIAMYLPVFRLGYAI
jgi:type IV pilus assembly protein PilC